MKGFKLLFTGIFFLGFIINATAQTHYYKIPWQNFTFQNKNSDDITSVYSRLNKKRIVSTPDIQISHLITLKEYKEFLKSTKDKMPDSLYIKFLPDSTFFKKGTFCEYMKETEYDLYPVPAVSWENAVRFCKWKTIKENKGDTIKFIYRLPTKNEWLSAKHFLRNMKSGHDFGIYFSDWIYNEYDELAYNYSHDLNPDYSSGTKTEEVFSVKRRLVLGNSFLFQYKNMNTAGIGRYSNTTAPYIAFRYVKDNLINLVNVKHAFNKKESKSGYRTIRKETLTYHFLKKWGLLKKVSVPRYKKNYDYDERAENSKNKKKFTLNIYDYAYYKNSNNKEASKKNKGLKATKKNSEGDVLKYFGEIKYDKKYGDWYFFNKKGELSKHCFYNKAGKCIEVNCLTEQNKFKFKNKTTSQNLYEFIDSIQKITQNNGEIISGKKYAGGAKDKRFNGYFAFSDRGDVNVAGRYVDNMKTGNWCMWDSNEKLLLQRNYKNGFEYETVYTTAPRNKLTAFLLSPCYSLQLNKDGYYDYYAVQEIDITWSKKIWRIVLPKNNKLIFEKYPLIEILIKHIKKGEITAYRINDRYPFNDTIKAEKAVAMYNTDKYELYGYEISEINFFDCMRFDMERRVLSICPILKNKETGRKTELFNIYVPETRKYFAEQKLSDTDLPDHIKTLDDVFFFNYFAGMITRESNVYSDRKISNYTTGKGIETEAKRIEEKILEFEYVMWYYYNNGN